MDIRAVFDAVALRDPAPDNVSAMLCQAAKPSAMSPSPATTASKPTAPCCGKP